MSAPVRIGVEEGVARVILARPEAANSLSLEMLELLNDAVAAAAEDPAVRVVRLGAEGRSFCAGIDLKSVELSDPDRAARFARGLSEVYRRLLTLPVPLLCSVEGAAVGGGVGLAAAADLVWAGPEARFSLPETRIGFVPALVSVVLRRRLTERRLVGLALSGRVLDSRQALAFGLADVLVEGPAGAEADQFASSFDEGHAPEAIRRTKEFLLEGRAESLEVELARARREFVAAAASEEVRRGLAAFRQGDSVRWDAD